MEETSQTLVRADGLKTILREHVRRLSYRDEGEGIAVFMAPGAGGTPRQWLYC